MPPKGKQDTKGQKQIAKENNETFKQYLIAVSTVNTVFLLTQIFLFNDSFTLFYKFMFMVCLTFDAIALYIMNSMAQATYDDRGVVIDGGIDLNMGSGMGEHMKDLIIITSIVQVLVLFSNYFWLIILTVPGRVFWMLWVNILQPWFFAPAPEVDEKKQKKMERKAKRQQIVR